MSSGFAFQEHLVSDLDYSALHLPSLGPPIQMHEFMYTLSSSARWLSSLWVCREVRQTDKVPELASQRYEVYEESRAALLALGDVLPVVTIDTSGNKHDVHRAIGTALSSHELSW